jgi:hypothetical protein
MAYPCLRAANASASLSASRIQETAGRGIGYLLAYAIYGNKVDKQAGELYLEADWNMTIALNLNTN